MSIAETRAATVAAETTARALAVEIVARYRSADSDATTTIAEAVEIILALAEKRAAVVRQTEIDRLAGFLVRTEPSATRQVAALELFVAENQLAAWVEASVDLGTLLCTG